MGETVGEWLARKYAQRVKRDEASLQDFRDLKRKKQIPSDSKQGIERTMETVAKRLEKHRDDLNALRGIKRHT